MNSGLERESRRFFAGLRRAYRSFKGVDLTKSAPLLFLSGGCSETKVSEQL
jgi:hypothetical protein